MTTAEAIACMVYRCSRQAEMYLYLRADQKPESLPAPLLQKLGRLTQVMELQLDHKRKLARVETAQVLQALRTQAYFLQLPPGSQIDARLYAGD